MELAKYKISLDALGRGTIEINGEDVASHVAGLTFQAQQGQPVQLFLQLGTADTTLEGEGVVNVMHGAGEEDFRQAMCDFLSRVDGGELEAAVLARDGRLGPTALEVLKEWINGGK